MTEEQRAELEKLARAATPGPWCRDRMEPETVRTEADHDIVVYEVERNQDAAFIAAANPATVLDLLATIARLEAEKVKDGEALEHAKLGAILLQSILSRAGLKGGAISAGELAEKCDARLSSRAKDQSQ